MNKVFEFQQNKINILGTHDIPMFFGSQIAKALGYMNTRDAIINHVWKENKTPVKEYRLISKGSDSRLSDDLHPQTILINEFRMYQLIMSSKLQTAKIFQQWLLSDVLPTIRKTGAYQMPKLINNQMMIMNETDLHKKVVDYLRKYFPDVLFNATLGENQDSSQKRIESYQKGYTSGIADIIIYEHNTSYNGFTIEFKSPNGKGVISEKQLDMNQKMQDRGYKTLISDSYDDICIEINKYLSDIRYKCTRCPKKFLTQKTMKDHLKTIHR
jgi:prophage antirepressor-like protein